MAWYAAHVIISVKFREGPQGAIPVYENVFLVEGESDEQVRAKAEALGRADEVHDESRTWEGRPADMVFEGIRKVIEIQSPPSMMEKNIPIDGSEVTYSNFQVESEEALQRLVNGEEVDIRYIE